MQAISAAAVLLLLAVAACAPDGSLPICSGPNRVSCVVDGDTIWWEREKIRLAGIDTPEVDGDCGEERRGAAEATVALAELLGQPFTIEREGIDRYGRTLARLRLADGRTAGDVLIGRGLAVRWAGRRHEWCPRLR